jgi:hypothetical protein
VACARCSIARSIFYPIRSLSYALFFSYVKLLLNPFYEPNTSITTPSFDARIKALVKKHL